LFVFYSFFISFFKLPDITQNLNYLFLIYTFISTSIFIITVLQMFYHPILSFEISHYIILLYLNTFFYITLTLIFSYNYRFFNHLSHLILNEIYDQYYINCYCIFLFLLLQHVSMDYEIILLQYLNRKTKLVIILFYCLFIKLLVIV
jgi:hypothetical protein